VVRETGLKLRSSSGADSVPGPDLMIVPEDAWQSAVKKRSWFEGVPMMVFEVISPSERRARRMQKVGLYLEIGIPYVVEVDYTRRVVLVHTPAADTATVYRADDQITEPFRACVSEIFAILD
jgi:Uma2 family endonuclease